MLEICYSINEAINILGSWEDIENLRQEILKFITSEFQKINIQIENNINPQPWNFVATDLEIAKNNAPVQVHISENRVIIIEGSKDNLEKFTSFLSFEKDAISGQHSHYEYYDGNEYVSLDSFPLIIEIK